MYGCNLSDFCITELKACTKGASMDAMTNEGLAMTEVFIIMLEIDWL